MSTITAKSEDIAAEYIGPLLIGTLLNVWLFGVILMQAHTYYQSCENDPRWLKWMVAWALVIETVSTSFASNLSYEYGVRDFGQPDKILIRTPVFSAFILTIGICSTTVQSFYAWRLRRLLSRPWIAWVIWAAAGVQMLCVIGAATGDSIVPYFKDYQKSKPVRIIVIIWMVLAPITDGCIAFLLVDFLRRSRTGFRKTDTILNRLTTLTIQTGAITALTAVLGLLLFISIPNFIHLVFVLILPQVYGVCLMSSLNARSAWSQELNGEQTYHPWSHGDAERGVHITTTTVTRRDNFELEGRTSDSLRVTHKDTPGVDIKHFPMPELQNMGDIKEVVIDDSLSLHSLSSEDDDTTHVNSHIPPRPPLPVAIGQARINNVPRGTDWQDML